MAGAKSKSKSATSKTSSKSKKPPPKPNNNILNYFAKVPPATTKESSEGPGSDPSDTLPSSLKRKWDSFSDESEARRANLTKAIEKQFGVEDSGQDEADEDDDLRSLFEEDTEDTPNEETGSQQAKGDTSDVKADPSVPEPAPEISPLGECFMCGKSLNGLDESQANSHVNECLDRTGAELQKHAEHEEICERQVVEGKFDNDDKEVIVIDGEEDEANPKAEPRESEVDASHHLLEIPEKEELEEWENDYHELENEEEEEEEPTPMPTLFDDDAPGTRVAPVAPMGIKEPSAFTTLMDKSIDKPERKRRKNKSPSEPKTPPVQRPCPFYKKLFQGIITVDAFRYNQIDGCNAYFLSHFHSDHYMGLSSSWTHGTIYCSRATANLLKLRLRVKAEYIHELPWETDIVIPNCNNIKVRLIDANHCPGSAIFLFTTPANRRVLHTGDFRATTNMVKNPSLFNRRIDELYLDTTYLSPRYSFPHTNDVLVACSSLVSSLNAPKPSVANLLRAFRPSAPPPPKGRLLVLIGTYSIGKERLAVAIARSIGTKIHVPASKFPTYKALEDPLLTSLLTTNPHDAQVHLTPLGNISIAALKEYIEPYLPTPKKPASFNRIVGIKPTGWTYHPPTSRNITNPTVRDVLNSPEWESPYKKDDMKPVRGSDDKVALYEVPYSEHSGFRDLTRFCCGLDIGKVIATVGVGGEKTRKEMAEWVEKWKDDRRRYGLWREKAVREKEGVGVALI